MNTRKTSAGRTAKSPGGATGTLGATTSTVSAKQKQVTPSSDLLRSFKATTNLANGLTKERVHIQNEFQKISAGKLPNHCYNISSVNVGKELLEEMRKIKKPKEPMFTAEEKASKTNKQEIKGTGFNLEMYCSEKGR